MKKILLLIVLQGFLAASYAQIPADGQMKKIVAELKKEITTLESEIRQADKDEAAALTKQLNAYKTMLAAFEKPKPETKPKPAATMAKRSSPSPIVKVQVKVPVVAPTAAQAKDRFFWFKGKKINDSTLVTTKKTLVQYSRKKQMLIIEPDEKKDSSFVTMARRIAKGEQVKSEMIDQFDKMKNGFIYYPYVVGSVAAYDDATIRYSGAINNTVSFKDPLPNVALQRQHLDPAPQGRGPHDSGTELLYDEELSGTTLDLADLETELRKVVGDAEKKLKRLPSIEDFPAPPRREVGRCASCDTGIYNRQRRADSLWIVQYTQPEQEIMQPVLSAAHTAGARLPDNGGDIQDKAMSILVQVLNRGVEKSRVLFNRYGNDIHYLEVVAQVMLGCERQSQLLGAGEAADFNASALLAQRFYPLYKKYYDEQVAARNHDFVLNVPYHLGIYRQIALLGADEKAGSVTGYIEEMQAYNRFALTLDLDFVWQQDGDGQLQRRMTGAMETKEKVFVWLFPDGCGYRILAHGTDLKNKKFEDITLPMKVKGGVKTVREENDELKDYPYTGAPEYAFRFPDSKVNFCDNEPDTLFLAVAGGNEEVAARAQGDLQNLAKSYTIEILTYLNQALINEHAEEAVEGMQDVSTQMLNTISGFMQQEAPGSTLDKLQTQYDGYMEMDNQRKALENAYSTKTARIVFNANNRATVLTDTYLDTKRKMDDDIEVKRGMFHLRMVHEPKR